MTDLSSTSTQGSRLQQAYAKHVARFSALGPSELTTINLDVPSMYMMATGTLNRLGVQRAEVLALPGIDKELVEHVDEYLLALGHAQALYLAASTPPAAIPELYEELLSLRTVLLADTTALVTRALMPGDKLADLRGPTSHAATAFDVLALSAILRAHWAQIEGKTALSLAELDRAESAADRLLTAVGERAAADEEAAAASRARQSAFTLFVRAYDELRRGIVYLRWRTGDADDIAPSLYAGRSRRRKGSDDPSEAPEPPAGAEAGPATPGAPAAPVTGAPALDPEGPFVA